RSSRPTLQRPAGRAASASRGERPPRSTGRSLALTSSPGWITPPISARSWPAPRSPCGPTYPTARIARCACRGDRSRRRTTGPAWPEQARTDPSSAPARVSARPGEWWGASVEEAEPPAEVRRLTDDDLVAGRHANVRHARRGEPPVQHDL